MINYINFIFDILYFFLSVSILLMMVVVFLSVYEKIEEKNKLGVKMIKNIEDLKNIQIVCRNQNQVKDCLNYLKQLGFVVEDFTEYCNGCNIIFWGDSSKKFIISNMLKRNLPIEFYNKELVKTLQKFIKQKEEKGQVKEEEKVKDFEVASDGRVIKINNKESEKQIFVVYDEAYNYDYEYYKENGMKIVDMAQNYLDFILQYGLAYETKKARDRALFKIEIETKLKNIAERLNAGRKIDWEDRDQAKFNIYYDFDDDGGFYCCLRYSDKYQGAIYCLDKNFLDVAKQEIGENDLIKYFKEDFN
jgi:hypothetical protein